MLLLASVTLTLSSQAQAKSWLESGGDFLDSLLGGEESSPVEGTLSSADISDGLKEALQVGTERVVSQLGQTNGFNGDELIHIPLPSQLKTAKTNLANSQGHVNLTFYPNDTAPKRNFDDAATEWGLARGAQVRKVPGFLDAQRRSYSNAT